MSGSGIQGVPDLVMWGALRLCRRESVHNRTCSATLPRHATFSATPPPSSSSSAAARAFADGCTARRCRLEEGACCAQEAVELLGAVSDTSAPAAAAINGSFSA